MKTALQVVAGLAIALVLYNSGYYVERAIRYKAFEWCLPDSRTLPPLPPDLPKTKTPGPNATLDEQSRFLDEISRQTKSLMVRFDYWNHERQACQDEWLNEGHWLFKR
jgi:hypothetical protein